MKLKIKNQLLLEVSIKNIIYNPVFENGQVNLGQFELIDVTRGEAQKDSQSQSNALTKSLQTAFTGVGRIEKNIIEGGC